MNKHKTVFHIFGIILLAIVLFFVNAFFGNPISYLLAKTSTQQYVQENYNSQSLHVEDPFYSFKISGYNAKVYSDTSIDTHFYLATDMWGHVRYDGYQYVTSGFNTWMRLDEEYRTLCDKVFDDPSFPANSLITYGEIIYEKEVNPEPGLQFGLEPLELDRDYDISEVANVAGHLVVYVQKDTCTFEEAAQILLQIRSLFDQANVPFRAIDFVIQPTEKGNKDILHVSNFAYEDIEEADLCEKLQDADRELSEWYAKEDAKLAQ